MRRIHPSGASTVGQVNTPLDPGDFHCYVEFPTLESQDEDGHMQQDEEHNNTPQSTNDNLEDDAMSQGTDQGIGNTSTMSVHNVKDNNTIEATTGKNGTIDVNGGINDDNLLAMMAKDASAIHTTTATDSSPDGPYGSREEKC